MARLMERKFRILILIFSTACLSMMLANILTLNFTILCMTEEKYRWENFTIDLGIDVFERVDFQSKRPPDIPRPPEVDGRTPSIPGFPDVEIPGIRVPTPGFNWQSFRLARQNPQLFLRLLKTVIVQVAEIAAQRAGEEFDPRNIDFRKFQNGFNLTDLNEDVIIRVKDYILRKVQLARNNYDILDAQGRNVSQWQNVTINDIRLKSITWNGVIQGEIRILDKAADFYYTPSEKALLFAIIAVGALIAIPFVSWSIQRFGCRKTFTIVGLISAISTALCPVAASAGLVVFLIVRSIQGVGFAACMPVIGAVTSAWAKLTENGLFNGALTCFIQLAPVIAMPISGLLCSSAFGWPAVFYIHSLLTLILILCWWFIYRDLPSESNHVLNAELRKIQAGKVIDGRQKHNRSRVFPLKEIYTDRSVCAVWVAAVGNMFAIQTLLLFGAIYISQVLHFPLVGVGFAAAIPTFLQFVVKLFAGISSDRVTRFTESRKLHIYNSIAFCGMAAFFILLALCPLPSTNAYNVRNGVDEEFSHWRCVALVLLICAAAILGFNVGGFFKSATLIGREYAYFINTVVQVIMCVAMLTAPFIVFALTAPDNEPSDWAWVFVLLAILLVVCNGVFFAFGSAAAAPFTNASKSSSASSTLADRPNVEQTRPIIVTSPPPSAPSAQKPEPSAPPAADS